MMFASSTASGLCSGMVDVCKTPAPGAPPVPVPYPNFAFVAQAVKFSTKVTFSGKPAVTMKSEIPKSQGDEPGTLGGMVSGQNMGKVSYAKGSAKVKVEGQPVEYHTAPTRHNGANANMPNGLQVAPSQFKVTVMP